MIRKSLIAYFCILPSFIFSQLRIDKIIPPSSNSAAIIKYCDHPTGNNYGIPQIKFPISTLINLDLFVPINLTYHTLGVKVEEEATWTGLGWYLQAGGMITRIVRGENDLGVTDFTDKTKAKGYPFEHIKPCFDDCEENENIDFHKAVCEGKVDSDPDIFFFDILGKKGKFLLTPDHDQNAASIEVKLISPKNIVVTFFIKENYWKMVDEDGFEYVFRDREVTDSHNNYFDHKQHSYSVHFDYQTSMVTSTWYLSQVTSPKGAKARFTYSVKANGSSVYTSDGAFQKMNINDENVWDIHYSSYCFPDIIENVQVTSQNRYKDIYLSSIESGDYVVNFSKSQQDIDFTEITNEDNKHRFFSDIPKGLGRQQLDKIEILKSGNTEVSAELFYSKFEADPDDDLVVLHHRLRLDSLVTSKRGQKNTVKFGYYNKIKLPSKESHARDLWGYYNGEEDFYNITPSDFFNYSQPEKMLQEEGRSKHYSLEHIQAGILNKITYSGGKVVDYIYDHQEFYNVDEEIAKFMNEKKETTNINHVLHPYLFGGLRIKEIVERYPAESIYKTFDYTINNKEDGRLIITEYSHDHHGYGHKTSGNHCVYYDKVTIKSGKLLNGKKF